MRAFLILMVLVVNPHFANARTGVELYYQGGWETYNRPLNGRMTAIVTKDGEDRYQARFYGTWQGVRHDDTVKFRGPLDNCTGSATIDGASYQWRGRIDKDIFEVNFTGNRYSGKFKLQRMKR